MFFVNMTRPFPASVGFPAASSGERAIRVRVLAAEPGCVALLKPAGHAWDDHPWNAGAPNLIASLRAQLAAGKPEMVALGLAKPASVHYIEPEAGGIALVADRATDALERWRTAFGSGLIRFTYRFLALTADAPEEGGECPLPVAAHRDEPRALVSHTTGKKSLTVFRVAERLGRWTVWEAVAASPRPHQVRLHAAEAGLRIIGETVYSEGGCIRLGELMRGGRLNKGGDRVISGGLALRIASADCTAVSPDLGVIAAEDEAWTGLIERLRAASRT